jgi:hypothetical protein
MPAQQVLLRLQSVPLNLLTASPPSGCYCRVSVPCVVPIRFRSRFSFRQCQVIPVDLMVECSKKFPAKKFIHVAGYKTTENLNTAFARIYEGRYLTGILAGLTESKLGYVAAFPIPEVIAGALPAYL